MDKSRIVVILILILIAVLFAVGIGAGFLKDDDGSPPKDERGIKSALKEVPDFVAGLGKMLSERGPRLKAEDLIEVKSQPVTLQPGAVLVTRVRASEDDDYRRATFRLIETGGISAVQIGYEADCRPEGMDNQKLELVSSTARAQSENLCNDEDKACGKLTIFKCGGTLTIFCIGPSACQIQLRD